LLNIKKLHTRKDHKSLLSYIRQERQEKSKVGYYGGKFMEGFLRRDNIFDFLVILLGYDMKLKPKKKGRIKLQ